MIRLLLNLNVYILIRLGKLVTRFCARRMKSHFPDAYGGDIATAVFATGLDCPVS